MVSTKYFSIVELSEDEIFNFNFSDNVLTERYCNTISYVGSDRLFCSRMILISIVMKRIQCYCSKVMINIMQEQKRRSDSTCEFVLQYLLGKSIVTARTKVCH